MRQPTTPTSDLYHSADRTPAHPHGRSRNLHTCPIAELTRAADIEQDPFHKGYALGVLANRIMMSLPATTEETPK